MMKIDELAKRMNAVRRDLTTIANEIEDDMAQRRENAELDHAMMATLHRLHQVTRDFLVQTEHSLLSMTA